MIYTVRLTQLERDYLLNLLEIRRREHPEHDEQYTNQVASIQLKLAQEEVEDDSTPNG